MRIGDFARLANVSPRTLRFYSQTGLLQPARVDPENSYRHYDPRQLGQLQQIHVFKEMGLALLEIRELLRRRLTAEELREVFRERRTALLKRMQEDFGRLAQIDAHLRALEGNRNGSSPEVLLRQTEPAWVVSLRGKIHRYEEAEGMFAEIERRVDAARFSEERAALWHTCAKDGPLIDCEVLRFLKGPLLTRGTLRAFQLPAVTVASVFHFGTDQTLEKSYRALAAWLTSGNFRLCGPKREIYWLEARPGSPAESVTEIQFPVARARDTKRVQQFRAA